MGQIQEDLFIDWSIDCVGVLTGSGQKGDVSTLSSCQSASWPDLPWVFRWTFSCHVYSSTWLSPFFKPDGSCVCAKFSYNYSSSDSHSENWSTYFREPTVLVLGWVCVLPCEYSLEVLRFLAAEYSVLAVSRNAVVCTVTGAVCTVVTNHSWRNPCHTMRRTDFCVYLAALKWNRCMVVINVQEQHFKL